MATTRVTVRVDRVAVMTLVERPGEIRRWFTSRVAATVAVAREEAPVRTGALARSIGSTYHGGGKWTIKAGAKYALYQHEGTKGPYKITPRPPKKTLMWEQDGRVVFARSVMHPGIQNPTPFLTTALERVWKSE